MGGVGFILLIACGNVANLVLAKGTTRLKEVAVRTSLGASRWQVFSQFLTESLVLAILGGTLGIGLGWAIIKIMMAKMPAYTLPSEADVTLNIPVLLFTLLATTIAGMLFGCAPAWHASRVDPNETLKEGGRSGTSAGRHRLRRSLVVGEFALALTLLAGAGLAIHSFWNLARVDPGFRTDHLLTFSLPVPEKRLKEPEQIVAYYKQLVDRIESIPGVVRAEAATGTPLQGTNFGMPFTIVGKAVADPSARPGAGFQMVTPGFFETFAIQMSKGRAFTDQDTASSVHVAIVNQTFVDRYFKGVDPLTQRILVEQLIPGVTKLGPPIEWQIVGVFRNIHNGGIRSDGFPEIDVPFAQSPWPQTSMAVRTTSNPARDEQEHRRSGALGRSPNWLWPTSRPWTRLSASRWSGTGSRRRFIVQLRVRRTGSGGDWHLRRDGLRRGPAHARDRTAHGPGCEPAACARTDSEGRHHPRGYRLGAGSGWRLLCRPRDAWTCSTVSARLIRCLQRGCIRSFMAASARLLPAGEPGVEGQSHRGAAL